MLHDFIGSNLTLLLGLLSFLISIVLCAFAGHLYLRTRTYRNEINRHLEQTTVSRKDHMREMNVIGVLANEYVTVCYVDVEKDLVTPYRIAEQLEERYGDIMRSGVSFEQIFRDYVLQDIYEEDRDFFLNLADLGNMLSYLHEHGSIAKKYRVWRDNTVYYCEMRVELVRTAAGVEDMVFGFSNNDMRVRREMVYQSSVQEEMDKLENEKKSLAEIADLALRLHDEIEEKLMQ